MVEIRQGIIPQGNPNRPGTKLANVPLYITVHETANTDAKANAEMHRVFTANGGGPENVSFHFAVDDHEAIQLLPLDEIGWHAGDGCDEYPDGVGHDDIGCFGSIAIETCVNSDGDFEKTLANLENLIANIVNGSKQINYGDGRVKSLLSIHRIAQHNAWSGKDCPHKIRSLGRWGEVVSGALREYNAIVQTGTVEEPVYHPVVPAPVYDGNDRTIGSTKWYALSRIVSLVSDATPRCWASTKANPAAKRIKAGRTFESQYIVENSEGWWYVSKEGWRILMSECANKFRPYNGKSNK